MKALAMCLAAFALWEAHAFSSGTAGQTTQEVVTKDTPATFTAKTNLVSVPVVVRDKNGKVVENLQKESFQLFDRGKLQAISSFSIVKAPGTAAPSPEPPANPPARTAPSTASPAPIPDQFIGLLFDDWHTNNADLIATRTAAEQFLARKLGPNDRVAVFTTSGAIGLDFTDDLGKLHQTLAKLLVPHATVADPTPESSCPYISRYMADLLVNEPNAPQTPETPPPGSKSAGSNVPVPPPQSLSGLAATLVVKCTNMDCLPTDGSCLAHAMKIVEAKVREIVAAGHDDTIRTDRRLDGCHPADGSDAGEANSDSGVSRAYCPPR